MYVFCKKCALVCKPTPPYLSFGTMSKNSWLIHGNVRYFFQTRTIPHSFTNVASCVLGFHKEEATNFPPNKCIPIYHDDIMMYFHKTAYITLCVSMTLSNSRSR